MKELSFEDWYENNEEKITIELAESGADREMDFNSEVEFDNRYAMYLDWYGNNKRKVKVLRAIRDEFVSNLYYRYHNGLCSAADSLVGHGELNQEEHQFWLKYWEEYAKKTEAAFFDNFGVETSSRTWYGWEPREEEGRCDWINNCIKELENG